MRFEWDVARNNRNLEKHGLDFADAVGVFSDPTALTAPDERKNYGDKRHNIIGEVAGRLVCVTFTRRAAAIRVISARIAHRKERMRYGQRAGRENSSG